jgi:hypothetical protein
VTTQIDISHPENAGVVGYLCKTKMRSASNARDLYSCSPDSVNNPYYNLGTHPDLVTRLWDEIAAELPVQCKWVVCGTPALVRPDSGIVFAFAGGTFTYALRLPPTARAELVAAALVKANTWAAMANLSGNDHENYVKAHAGDVWEYCGGSTLDIRTIGEQWVFGRFLNDEVRWCRTAYDFAA